MIRAALTSIILLVTSQTVRRWEREVEILPVHRSDGRTRYYYDLNQLLGFKDVESDLTIAYARVSSRDQKDDLKRQVQRLEMHCAAKGWSYEVIQDPRFGDELQEEGPEAN